MKFLLSVLIFAFPLIAVGQDAAIEAEVMCDDIQTCVIPYVRLSNQETDPFLFLGLIMDERRPRWRQYSKSLSNFPDVRDCLIEEEQEKDEPNLLLIDWQHVGTTRGAEVCIFRIVSSLGTPKRAEHWLKFHGFETRPLQRLGSDNEKHRYETEPWYNISATWTMEQYREINPNWFLEMLGVEIAYNYALTLTFSKNEIIVGVHAGANVG